MTIEELVERLKDCKQSNKEQAIVYINNDLFFPVEDIIIKYGHLIIQCRNVRDIESE